MAVCELTGEKLPERNSHFCGYACNKKDNFQCKNWRMHFKDGTNCYLLQRPFDKKKVASILGLKTNTPIADGGK